MEPFGAGSRAGPGLVQWGRTDFAIFPHKAQDAPRSRQKRSRRQPPGGTADSPGMTWRAMRLLLIMCDLELATGTEPGEVADYLESLLGGAFLPVVRA